MTPPLVWIESRLVEFLHQSSTAQEAAEKFADFLELSCPTVIDQLLTVGKTAVAGLFQSEAVLRDGTAGIPQERLQEFVDKFFACVSDDAAPGGEEKPN